MVQQQSILNYISSLPNVSQCESLLLFAIIYGCAPLLCYLCFVSGGAESSMCMCVRACVYVPHTQRNSGETENQVKHHTRSDANNSQEESFINVIHARLTSNDEKYYHKECDLQHNK